MVPLDVFLLGQDAFEYALFAEDVTFLAAQRVDEGLQTQTTDVERLDGVLAEPLLLRSVPEFSLLVVGEEGEIVIVLRVSLRHVLVKE